jgi:hypothetical protein
MEYVEKLRVSEKLERVQQAKSDLDSQSAGARMVDLFS